MLTGLAAVVTAVTGLVVAVRQFAPPPRAAEAASEVPVASRPVDPSTHATSRGPVSVPPARDGGAERAVAIPPGSEATLGGGDLTIAIVRARLGPYSADDRRLTITVRFSNTGRNFDRTYYTDLRLVTDGMVTAPDAPPLEQVEGHSTREFDYLFKVPAAARSVVLRIIRGEESREIPLNLSEAT